MQFVAQRLDGMMNPSTPAIAMNCFYNYPLITLLILCMTPSLWASELIVDWGHDWGNGWYRQTPHHEQNGLGWKKMVEEDLNGNGTTADDHIGGWQYSYDEPLNPTHIIYDDTYPSATFYGAAVVMVTGFPKKEDGSGYIDIKFAPSEGHINQNHEWRDDWNLMSFPVVRRQPELAEYAGAMLAFWKKEDFLNGGAHYPVAFDENSYIGVFVSRYWGGINWGRWVVQDGDQFYVSKNTFAGVTEQFDLTDSQEGDGASGNPVCRRTHATNPLEELWAEFNPQAPHHVFFDPDQATYERRTFKDVRAVGFLAQRDMSIGRPVAHGLFGRHGVGEPIALKYNAVQVRAKVQRPAFTSEYVDMVPVGDAQKPALWVSKTEVSYQQWLDVYRWAVTNQRASHFEERFKAHELGGYSFLGDGAMGSATTLRHALHQRQEPVTEIQWLDAIVWCNALSDLEGLEPAYYEDAAFTVPYRVIYDRSKNEQVHTRKPVYWKARATGYRLPSADEFAALIAMGNADASDAHAWVAGNSGLRTHPVGSKQADALGLHDLVGNVGEFVWDASGSVWDLEKQKFHRILGGGFMYPEAAELQTLKPFEEEPYQGTYNIGFRVVRNGSGMLELPTQKYPYARIVTQGAIAQPVQPMSESALKAWAEETLAPVTIADAGSLPENDNYLREYKRGEAYDLALSKVEVPYRLWEAVCQWAERTRGYRFNHAGDMGSAHYVKEQNMQADYSYEEPVTNITWFDAVVWCNAVSELLGLEPVYFDKDTGEVMRVVTQLRLPMYLEYHYPNTGNYDKRTVDTASVVNIQAKTQHHGFRLPTFTEMQKVHQPSDSEDSGWFLTNSQHKTQPVGTKNPDDRGLYDIEGNVQEMTYGGGRLFGQFRFGNSFAELAGHYTHPMARKEVPFVGRSYVGFRPVRRP